jgi:hypothetical protein
MKLGFVHGAAAAAALMFASAAAVPANAQETLNNEAVIQLLEAGLPAEAVVAKIKASRGNFDTSTQKLIELKNKGVPGPVLAAMLEPANTGPTELSTDSPDPNVPHYPGVYMFGAGDNRMYRMVATASNQAKTGGILGYALTMGIASASVKATIPGASAKVRTANAQPVFYMFFDESVPRNLAVGNASVWTTGAGSVTSSPAELSLVRFNEKKEAREARVGSMNIAGAKQGVMDKDRITFEVEQIKPGVFKVMPSAPLEPGEYGFIQALTGGNVSGGGGAMTARVYDFGVGG